MADHFYKALKNGMGDIDLSVDEGKPCAGSEEESLLRLKRLKNRPRGEGPPRNLKNPRAALLSQGLKSDRANTANLSQSLGRGDGHAL